MLVLWGTVRFHCFILTFSVSFDFQPVDHALSRRFRGRPCWNFSAANCAALSVIDGRQQLGLGQPGRQLAEVYDCCFINVGFVLQWLAWAEFELIQHGLKRYLHFLDCRIAWSEFAFDQY